MSLKPFALIAPDACVVTCGYRLHSEIISRFHLLIRQYQQLIGTLLYTALGTRPNIAFAVTRLSRFNSDPTEEHLRYAKYVCTKGLERDQVTLNLLRWIIESWPYRLFRLRLGRKQR